MSDDTQVSQLLAAALDGAADVARNRLGRDVQVVAAEPPSSSAILRFDLPFLGGGRLTWFITNDDATGLSDLLIGGSGDRSAVLTEMHLDALTVAFGDMLTRAVESIGHGVDEPLQAGEIDLGMESELPDSEPASTRLVLALQVEGFGPLVVVQQADADLTQWLDLHALAEAFAAPPAPAAPVPEPAAVAPAEDQPEPAGPPPATAQPAPGDAAANVVSLAGAAPAAAATQPGPELRSQGDLEMLMNVPLPLTVELGSTQRTIRELVDFSIGSIIELGKLAGDPLDIKVNDRVIARGEVVVIDEEFGIRVTEIVSPEDRLRGLG